VREEEVEVERFRKREESYFFLCLQSTFYLFRFSVAAYLYPTTSPATFGFNFSSGR